nr:RNA-dependent RNA polymerase [Fusarium asiaticum ourmiavirus 1]
MSLSDLGKRDPGDDCRRRRPLKKRAEKPCSSNRDFVRTAKNLQIVSQLMVREGLREAPYSPSYVSCDDLQKDWKHYVLRSSGDEERELRLSAYLKGTRSLFDIPCDCIDARRAKASKAWMEKMMSPQDDTPDWLLSDVRGRVRSLLRTRRKDFWESWNGEKDVEYRVPDTHGCFEAKRGTGGTFRVPEAEYHQNPGDVRASTILTKGKFRAVTMQPANVKRLLDAPMEAAYDWLSGQSWVVRGDVDLDHYATIRGDDDGREYVSGDYSSATDNLKRDAVICVVEEIADCLPTHLGELLVRSFSEVAIDGAPVLRGSMMGSKFSFVVLCLLNRVCFDIAMGCKTYKSPGFGNDGSSCLINGDDIAFRANESEFEKWKFFTSLVGFVVNVEKTHLSHRYVEINSQPVDMKKFKLLPKPSFGFFSPDGDQQEGWEPLLKLVSNLSWSSFTWFCSQTPVVKIFSKRYVSVGSFESRLWRFFVKKRWFRTALTSAPQPSRLTLPMKMGPVLDEEDEQIVRGWEREAIREYVSCRIGKPPLFHEIEDKPDIVGSRPTRAQRSLRWEARRLWVGPVLDAYREMESGVSSGLLASVALFPITSFNDVTLEISSFDKGYYKWPAHYSWHRGWYDARCVSYKYHLGRWETCPFSGLILHY